MNDLTNKPNIRLRPIDYWWLWVLDAVFVSGGFLFYLATNYGTGEFFGLACAMALLPLIPVMVLVGGAGSTVFALTKVWIGKHTVPRPKALVLLVGPALVITLALGLLVAFKSPAHRLAYICIGHAPASVSQVQITGYSAFLREEWLTVFGVDQKNFQTFIEQAKLEPVPSLEFSRMLEHSSLKATGLFQKLPQGELACFKRVFKEAEEHERGSVYAAFTPATGTAVVFREYHD